MAVDDVAKWLLDSGAVVEADSAAVEEARKVWEVLLKPK